MNLVARVDGQRSRLRRSLLVVRSALVVRFCTRRLQHGETDHPQPALPSCVLYHSPDPLSTAPSDSVFCVVTPVTGERSQFADQPTDLNSTPETVIPARPRPLYLFVPAVPFCRRLKWFNQALNRNVVEADRSREFRPFSLFSAFW